MPVKVGRGTNRSKRSNSTAATRQSKRVVADQVAERLLDTRPPSRIRRYVPADKGRNWNDDSPDTPEGRLAKFNPEDWHAPAKDDNGHTDRLMVDFHPAIIDELSAHCNSGNFPLGRSVKQAVRVAVFEFLQILRKLQPLPDSHMVLIEQATLLNSHAQVAFGYEEQFAVGRKNANKYIAMGAKNQARKLVHDLITVAKKIPVRELRDKYRTELEYEFRSLLKTSNVAKTNVKKNRRRRAALAKIDDWT
jgi:hypothetical protein